MRISLSLVLVAAATSAAMPQFFAPNAMGQQFPQFSNNFESGGGFPSAQFGQGSSNSGAFGFGGGNAASFPQPQFAQNNLGQMPMSQRNLGQPSFQPVNNMRQGRGFAAPNIMPRSPFSNNFGLQTPINNMRPMTRPMPQPHFATNNIAPQPMQYPQNNMRPMQYQPNNALPMPYPESNMRTPSFPSHNMMPSNNYMRPQPNYPSNSMPPMMPGLNMGVITITASNAAHPIARLSFMPSPNNRPSSHIPKIRKPQYYRPQSSDEEEDEDEEENEEPQSPPDEITFTAAAEVVASLLSAGNIRQLGNKPRFSPVSVSLEYSTPQMQNNSGSMQGFRGQGMNNSPPPFPFSGQMPPRNFGQNEGFNLG